MKYAAAESNDIGKEVVLARHVMSEMRFTNLQLDVPLSDCDYCIFRTISKTCLVFMWTKNTYVVEDPNDYPFNVRHRMVFGTASGSTTCTTCLRALGASSTSKAIHGQHAMNFIQNAMFTHAQSLLSIRFPYS